ncbi:MAG TPA: hypothetical protein VK427_16255 [Kofleriaceae bacterium]|nr:hypothetical protein [Kofleriaceae bacterium]
MRWLALVSITLLAGCPLDTPSTGECGNDSDCDGNVCARDNFCHPAANVREVKTTWTILGKPASKTTCGPVEDLQIGYSGGGAGEQPLSYAPVPCENGQFVIDKLPRTFTVVELGKHHGVPMSKVIGASSTVEFDLSN